MTPSETIGFVIRHSDHGVERFEVAEGSCNLHEAEGGVWEFVIKVSAGAAIERSAELQRALNPAKPWFEAAAIMGEGDLDLRENQVITQKEGYDHDRDEHLSNFCYFGHESVENLKVELLAVAAGWIDARITGEVVITGSKGMEADAGFVVETRLLRDPSLRRGVC